MPPPGILPAIERRDLIRMGGLLVLLLVATGAVLLAGTGSGGGSGPPAGSRWMDGVLTSVSETELVLQPSDGSPPVRFPLTPASVRQLDLFHLELHARDQLQSRVFFTQKGDTRTVVRVDDL